MLEARAAFTQPGQAVRDGKQELTPERQRYCTPPPQARAARKPLLPDGVQTSVYKALHLAKLAPLFRRVHHG